MFWIVIEEIDEIGKLGLGFIEEEFGARMSGFAGEDVEDAIGETEKQR